MNCSTRTWLSSPLRSASSTLLIVVTACLLMPFTARAAYMGTLTFVEPVATVGPSETIPVWVRFTLDPASDPLEINTDAGGSPPFGIPASNIPESFSLAFGEPPIENLQGISLTSLSDVFLNTGFSCSGTFTSSCTSGPPYKFTFNTSGPDTINFLPAYGGTFALQPGESHDYLFGSFAPSAGPVASGTYTFPLTTLMLQFRGIGIGQVLVLDGNGDPIPALDEDGNPILDEFGDPVYQTEATGPLNASASIDLASTAGQAAFTRTVVPLPGTLWLLGAALGAMGLMRRR